MADINASLSLENVWNNLIKSGKLPNRLHGIIPQTQKIDIDARQVGDIILSQQTLLDLQFNKRELISIAEPIFEDLSNLVKQDTFMVLCAQDGSVFLAQNTSNGRVCPGSAAGGGQIRRVAQSSNLIELKIYHNGEACQKGYFNTIVYPIRDGQQEAQAFLSMGSFTREISDELRHAVYLGASLIETRFKHRQLLKNYTDALIKALPDISLLIDDNGCIESINENLIHLIGIDNAYVMIGKPFDYIFKTPDKTKTYSNSIEQNRQRYLAVDGQNIYFTVANATAFATPFGTTARLIILKKSTYINGVETSARQILHKENAFDKLIGKTPQMERIKSLGKKVAASSLSVLIGGESGTGKELYAEAIHAESGRKGLFIPVNCGSFPKELLQSELFGYTEGTFTGGQKGGKVGKLAAADGGTLFLDEIGEMPEEMQISLLRFLQDKIVTRIGENVGKRVDVRIIAASNRDLLEEMNNKRFRQDLYYRLNEISINLPPLRYRKDDIPILVTEMLNRICREMGLPAMTVEDEAMAFLTDYDWPGNCRELQNVVKTAAVLTSGNHIKLESLRAFFNPVISSGSNGNTLQEIEEQVITNRFRAFGGNISKAADSLKISRATLYRKLKDYNVTFDEI